MHVIGKKLLHLSLLHLLLRPLVFHFFSVGTRSFGGGYSESFGSAKNLLLGIITLAACLLFNIFAKSYWKQLSVLFGLIVGYILAIFMGKVDLSVIFNGGLIA